MTRRPMFDLHSASLLMYTVLSHHLGRPATDDDYGLCVRIVGNHVRLIAGCVSDGARFYLDIDADSLPQLRAKLGTVAH